MYCGPNPSELNGVDLGRDFLALQRSTLGSDWDRRQRLKTLILLGTQALKKIRIMSVLRICGELMENLWKPW